MVLGHIRWGRAEQPLLARHRVHTYVRPKPAATFESGIGATEAANLTQLLAHCYAEGCLASSEVLARANREPALYRLLPARPLTVNGLRRFRRCHRAAVVKALAQALTDRRASETGPVRPETPTAQAEECLHLAQLLDLGLEDD